MKTLRLRWRLWLKMVVQDHLLQPPLPDNYLMRICWVNTYWMSKRLSPLPPIRLVSCDQSGDAYFEVRDGLPVTFQHGCDFNGEIAAEWELRMCWEVSVAMLDMRPVCKTKTFFPHAKDLGEQLDSIKLELQQLKEDRP